MSAKGESMTMWIDASLKERLDAAIGAMPYRPTISMVVERGILLAINEMEKMMKAASTEGDVEGTRTGFALRLPEALHDKIKASAKANGRSMNAEIVHALSQIFQVE